MLSELDNDDLSPQQVADILDYGLVNIRNHPHKQATRLKELYTKQATSEEFDEEKKNAEIAQLEKIIRDTEADYQKIQPTHEIPASLKAVMLQQINNIFNTSTNIT